MNRRNLLASAIAALGIVPFTASTSLAQSLDENVMRESNPMAAAEYLSILEGITHVPALYTFYSYMHPDSQAIVPRATIIGWYQNDFQPLGPQPAVATGVTYLDQWVWQVTGQAYSNVAEVTFTQAFANGSVSHDAVRLCWHNDQWNWFFGRDRAWVEEQNLRFSLKDQTPQGGDAPFGFERARNLETDLTPRLPSVLTDEYTGRDFHLTEATHGDFGSEVFNTETWMAWESDHRDDIVPAGYFGAGTIENYVDDASALDAIATLYQNSPPLRFHGWNANPTTGLPWIHLGIFQNDMVGFVDSVYLVADGRFIHVSMMNPDNFSLVSSTIGGV